MTLDLSQLVEDTNPASIQNKLLSMAAEAEKIRETNYGKIQSLDANGLMQLLEAKDSFTLKFEDVIKYCNLLYTADSTNDVAKQLNDASCRAIMKASQALALRVRPESLQPI